VRLCRRELKYVASPFDSPDTNWRVEKGTWLPGRPCCWGSIDCDVVRARSPGVVGRLACCDSGLAASIVMGSGL